jgi:hypothetical protein
LEKIASDFFDTAPHFRRQKARFLPPARPRSYAQALTVADCPQRNLAQTILSVSERVC